MAIVGLIIAGGAQADNDKAMAMGRIDAQACFAKYHHSINDCSAFAKQHNLTNEEGIAYALAFFDTLHSLVASSVKSPEVSKAALPGLQVWRDEPLSTWKQFYGEPTKIENPGKGLDIPDDGSRAYYWNVGRVSVEATFYSNEKLCCFNIGTLAGKKNLTLSEAKQIANSLGLPPYHKEDGQATWGTLKTDGVTAFFDTSDPDDISFHFEASHENLT